MLFTIVCRVFSCLCRFPVVHAVITQGSQLHRLSVLGVQKPLSSYPLGLKCWWWFSSQNDSEWFQKLGYLGLRCYICKIFHPLRIWGHSNPAPSSSICSAWSFLVELSDPLYIRRLLSSPSYQSLSFSCDKRTVTASLEKSDDGKRTQTHRK